MKTRVARSSILEIKPYLPGKPIEEVKRELGVKQVVKLASNECPVGPSPKVVRAITQAIKGLNRYPDGGCFHLRQELSRRLKVKPNQLIFGNGSDEIIVMVIRAFVREDDEVIVAQPSFLIYEIASQIAGAKIRSIPLKDFYYDLEGMRKAVKTKTKVLFIGNPDNPASTYLTHNQLRDFLNELPKDVVVIIDEAYFEFVENSDYPDSIKLLQSYSNLVITRTFSKMYGLAGLRIGYGIAHADMIDILNRIREPFNVNSLAQAAALSCLKDGAYYRRVLQSIRTEKKALYRQFKVMGLSYIEGVTNFILLNVNKNSTEVSQGLLKRGVIVRDMDFWGLKNYIRVSIGTPKENQKFIRALKEVL